MAAKRFINKESFVVVTLPDRKGIIIFEETLAD